jgi:hypothetical protein
MSDSKTLLFTSNRTGRNQIFRQEIEQEAAEPLITGPDEQGAAELSPDGSWILFWSYPPSAGGSSPAMQRVMRFPVSGGPPAQILESPLDATTDFQCPLHAAGSCILALGEQGQLIFYSLDPVRGRGKELGRTSLGSPTQFIWVVSPESSRIAIESQDKVGQKIRILDLKSGLERNLPVPQGWRIGTLNWAADGNALLVGPGYLIARLELDGKVRVLLNRKRNQWLSYPCPSPDGRHLAFSQQARESNAWLLENF